MNKDILVAPSILSANLMHLGNEVVKAEQAGADWLHIDVMDGHFVPNLTFGIPIVQELKRTTSLPLDVHLMIHHPQNIFSDFISAGASSISFHPETTHSVQSILKEIKKSNVLSGLAIKPNIEIESIFHLLKEVDFIMIMLVYPGFSGQTLIKKSVGKIQKLKKELKRQNLSVKIQVDGGVNQQTASLVSDADIFVCGHYVFKNNNYKKAIFDLRRQIQINRCSSNEKKDG